MPASFVHPPLPEDSLPARTVVATALRRPAGRRTISLLSTLLLVAGIGLFAYPVLTDVSADRRQSELRGEFADPEYQQAYRERRISVGQGLTRLRIPELDVDVLVVEGTTVDALRAGAGHYVGSPLPGEPGNVAIAGHRTTYGRPFARIDELERGDVVELETPFAVYTYRVMPEADGHENPWVVRPTAVEVVGQRGADHWLTLTTCHPKGSNRRRLILRLELTDTTPVERPA